MSLATKSPKVTSPSIPASRRFQNLDRELATSVPTQLTQEETAALKRLLADCAKAEREDIIGLFMRHGLFRVFESERGLVNLAKKFGP